MKKGGGSPTCNGDRISLRRRVEFNASKAPTERASIFVFIPRLRLDSCGLIAKLDEKTDAVQSGIVRSRI
jgi:hypothetical protein